MSTHPTPWTTTESFAPFQKVRDADDEYVLIASATLALKLVAMSEAVEELRSLIPRFELCALASGTDEEFVRASTAEARAVLARS